MMPVEKSRVCRPSRCHLMQVPVAAETWHPQAAPAPPSRSSLFCTGSGCEGTLGVALESLQGLRDLT